MSGQRQKPILLLALALVGTSGAQAAQEAWNRVSSAGELRWGADATGGAPYIFPDRNNPKSLIGFEIELMEALGRQLHLTPRLVQAPWEELVPALQRGDFDIVVNGLEVTPDRRQVIDFSVPYYYFSEQITARKGDHRFTSMADLRGHRVGTLAASLAFTLLTQTGSIEVVPYPSPVESYRDLTLGRVDAVLMDLPIAAWYAQPNPALENTGEPIGEGVYAVGVRKDSPELLRKVNDGLAALAAQGELERIYRKWNLWNERQARLKDASLSDGGAVAERRSLKRYVPLLLAGAGMTLLLSVLSMALAVVAGALLCVAKLYGNRLWRSLAATYIEIIRGTPLLIQLYLLYYGLPNVGIHLNAFTAAILGMGLNYAAYEAEIYRSGLLSIPRGQSDAARSLGMTPWQTLWHILSPQAIRTILPPSTNDFIALFKDTSLVSVITVTELTKVYSTAANTSYRFLELGLMTAALYFLMSYPLATWSRKLERRQHAALH